MLSGGLELFGFARNLVDLDVPGWSLELFDGLLGLVDVVGGLAFLCLPSLRAFFRYQRAGALTGIAREDRLPSPSPIRFAIRSGLMTAGICGIALVVFSAIWGGFFGFHPGATIYGSASSGWAGAIDTVSFSVMA